MSFEPQMGSPSGLGPPPGIAVGERALAAVVSAPVEAVRLREVAGGVKVELAPGRALRVDGEGRWITARIGPWILRRRVDGGIVFAGVEESAAAAAGEISTRDAPPNSPWHRVVATLAAALRARLRFVNPESVEDPDGGDLGARRGRIASAEVLLRRASELGPSDFLALHQAFREAYAEPVPILPPDRYRDLVILPAVGCPHAACTFCAWYHDATFQAFDGPALETHLDRVDALFGEGLDARDGLFLGSASAFSVSDERLLALLAEVGERFGSFRRGVAGFLDPHHAPERSAEDWKRLRQAGVVEVVAGLETAHAPLRARLGKDGDLEAFTRNILALRSARVGCGITVLAGAAYPSEAEEHRRKTIEYLEMLALGPEDRIYLSPWDGAADRQQALEEAEALGEALAAVSPARRSTYAMDRYRYYA